MRPPNADDSHTTNSATSGCPKWSRNGANFVPCRARARRAGGQALTTFAVPNRSHRCWVRAPHAILKMADEKRSAAFRRAWCPRGSTGRASFREHKVSTKSGELYKAIPGNTPARPMTLLPPDSSRNVPHQPVADVRRAVILEARPRRSCGPADCKRPSVARRRRGWRGIGIASERVVPRTRCRLAG